MLFVSGPRRKSWSGRLARASGVAATKRRLGAKRLACANTVFTAGQRLADLLPSDEHFDGVRVLGVLQELQVLAQQA